MEMNLEQRLQRKGILVTRLPEEVQAKIRAGSRFIVVDESMRFSEVPRGFTLIDMKYKTDVFRALVPQELLFYIANPGESNANEALDCLTEFYTEVEGLEDTMMGNGNRSVQEADWATLARRSYGTYLINKLVKSASGKLGEDGEPLAEFNQETIKQLDLNDPYVMNRAKAIAGIALEKTVKELEDYNISDVLKHVTISERQVQKLTWKQFHEVACYAGSHYELRAQYRNSNATYNLANRTVTKDATRTVAMMDKDIATLESEIEKYRAKNHSSLSPHDAALIRQFINLKYIAKEKPESQIDIRPPEYGPETTSTHRP
jgi:hypothetical protein